ncbi:MAG: hypothetical protein ABJG47_04965 [Ekhidna sp.]
MKKIIALTFIVLSYAGYSQEEGVVEATKKGNLFFEVGTSVFGETALKHGNSTGFSLLSSEGTTIYSIGAEGGYFVQDNTAIKVGLGYSDIDFSSFFTYKFGIKHYAGGNVPLQIDITGATNEDQESFGGGSIDTPDPLWLGVQMGYAAFLSDNITFEPTIRYNSSLNSDFTSENLLEFKFNFVIFF